MCAPADVDDEWSSLFLALGSDVSQYVPPVGGVAGGPQPSANLLRLHRAVGAANWPSNQSSPYLFGQSRFGSRLFRQPAYARLRKELPLAIAERITDDHGGTPGAGVLISGNAGTGKVCHWPGCSASCTRFPPFPTDWILIPAPLSVGCLCVSLCIFCRALFCWIICTNSFILVQAKRDPQ